MGDGRLNEAAEVFWLCSCRSGTITLSRSANALGSMALAGGGILEVVVAGDRTDLLECAQRRYEPDAVIAWGDRTASPLWESRSDGAAYVCHQSMCLVPATTVGQLNDQLESEGHRSTGAPAPRGPDQLGIHARQCL